MKIKIYDRFIHRKEEKMNNRGSFTLEASLVMTMIIVFITMIISFMILFFNRGIYEGELNAQSLRAINERSYVKEHITLPIRGSSKSIKLYNQSVSDDFLKSLVIEDYIIQGRRWLDE